MAGQVGEEAGENPGAVKVGDGRWEVGAGARRTGRPACGCDRRPNTEPAAQGGCGVGRGCGVTNQGGGRRPRSAGTGHREGQKGARCWDSRDDRAPGLRALSPARSLNTDLKNDEPSAHF